MLYYHLWPIWLYDIFRHYLINGIFSAKTLSIKYVFWFSLQLFLGMFLILRRHEWEIIINIHRYSVKYAFFLSDFNETWTISTHFRKIIKFKISWKSVLWEPSCSVRTTDGRTYMTRLMDAFRKLANSPKICNNISETKVHHKTLHVLSIHVAIYHNQATDFNLHA